jgi:cellulose synthase/poly-beta-1,6-N-acetylglucosamine synthase-like glycosyltransferase
MIVVVVVHAVSACLLALWGAHRVWQLIDFARRRTPAPDAVLAPVNVSPSSMNDSHWPTVTVQLPLYNERAVCGRAIDAICALEYPREKFSVQVLDDSTDDTSDVVAAHVVTWQRAGVDVTHVRRACRDGYKAGALAHGLLSSKGELVAVFDADFAPDRDFLTRLVPTFIGSDVAMVQARWEHENRTTSALTRAQAACLDAHFSVEHAGRSAAGRFFNFNGTAGVWRRSAIDAAGGWDARTLTEDLDLSLRAFLAGSRFIYRDDVAARAELPSDVNAFLGQQHRWAKGSMQTARARLPAIWRATLPFAAKLDLTLKLTQNAAFLWLALVALTLPIVLVWRIENDIAWLRYADALALSFATLPVVVHLLASARARARGLASVATDLPLAFFLGAALSIPNAIAVLAGFLDVGDQTFHRTPKRGGSARTLYPMRASMSVLASLALAAVHLSTAVWMITQAEFVAVPMLLLFGIGLAWLSLQAIAEVFMRKASLFTRGRRALVDRAPRRA